MATNSAQSELDNFCADVVNVVQDYCDDGIDAFENCLVNAPQIDDETRQIIIQGSNALHQDLTSKVSASMSLFVELCKSTVLHAPMPLHWPVPDASSTGQEQNQELHAIQQQHEELDQKLEQLRKQILQEDQECSQLAERLQRVEQQIQQHGAGVPGVTAVAGTLSADVGVQVADDVAALDGAMTRLQPLLERAWAVSAQHAAQAKMSGAGHWRVPASDRVLLGSLDNVMTFT